MTCLKGRTFIMRTVVPNGKSFAKAANFCCKFDPIVQSDQATVIAVMGKTP